MNTQTVTELRRMAHDLRTLARSGQRALLQALDATASDVAAAERHEIDDSFDQPTPWTQRGVFVAPTTRSEPVATVGLRRGTSGARGPGRYLAAQIEGGGRRFKALETLVGKLAARDGFTPIAAGGQFYLVPGPYANLDAYGNVSRGQLMQILSQLRLFQGAETVSRNLVRRDGMRGDGLSSTTPEMAKRKRAAAFRRAGGQFFVVPPGGRSGLHPGIYQRQVASRRLTGPASPKPRPVFWFVDRVRYEQRFDFWFTGENTIAKRWPQRMAEALARQEAR